ncbi:MAG TPA: DinB family protein [Ignavibacteria bacterium]|nr:DinB family protein [Ignavibacteria bacterium]
MNILYNTISRIENHLVEVSQKLKEIPEKDLSFKRAPGKWSKKEILGHLCDSAVNNLSRFIRAQFETEPFVLNKYQQDDWVRVNHYQDMNIEDIVNFWISVNKRINYVVSKMPEEKLGIEIDHNGATYADPKGNKTLLWLFEDYLAHMEYHLKQILN